MATTRITTKRLPPSGAIDPLATRWRQLPIEHAEVKAGRDSWRFVISHEGQDLMGDVVVQAGLKPVSNRIPAQVDHSGKVRDLIGWWDDIQAQGKRTTATLRLFAKGLSPVSDLVRALLDEGVRMAASIGFVPVRGGFEAIMDKSGEPTGWRFAKSLLIETSVVVVPAQPLALNVGKSLGLAPERVARFVRTPTQTVPTFTPAQVDAMADVLRPMWRDLTAAKARPLSPKVLVAVGRAKAALNRADAALN